MKWFDVGEHPPDKNSFPKKETEDSKEMSEPPQKKSQCQCLSEPPQKKSQCQCLSRFHYFFYKNFFKLGRLIGKYPSYFILVPAFLTLLGLTGFQRINIIKDSDYLFVPTDGVGKYTRDTIEKIFPMNSSYEFDPSRITRANDFAKLLITTKDNDTILRTKVWDEVILLDAIIQNLTIQWEDQYYNYSEICSTWDSVCFPNLIYNMNEIMYEVENGSMFVSYPVMLFPLVLPLFYGGPEVNETEGVLISTKGVYTTYFLAHDNWKQRERSYLWEGALLDLLLNIEFEHISIDPLTARSMQEELAKNGDYMKRYFPLAMALLFIFSVVTVSSSDWVRSKTQMALLGILTIIMAIIASFGWLMYMGVPFVIINSAIPFLVLGLGLDDVYIMLSSWKRTKLQDSVKKRMAEMYSDVAVSVTITSLTNLLSFFVGTTSSFPAARIFCIYLGTSVLFAYVWILTFFGACLAMVGYMEKEQRHALSCRVVKPKSLSEDSCCYSAWCAGGIDSTEPWNVKDNKQSMFSKFFKDYYGKALTTTVAKVLVICIFFVYLGGAVYGSTQLKQGIDRHNISIDGSYLTEFYETEDKYFRKFPYRIQVVIRGDNMTFHSNETKKALMNIHSSLEETQFIGPRLYTRSWMRGYYNYLRRRSNIRENITDEASFIYYLQNKFFTPNMRESVDIAYNENGTRIIATRFIIQGYEVHNMEEDFEMIRQLREVAENLPYEVLVYHPSFVYYDQYLAVGPSALRITLIASVIVILTSLFFIPNPISVFWIGISILSINFGVVGYMALWNVRLDTIALVNLIMCIGFSVDYSAHISYSFLTCSSKSSSDKVRYSLYKMGLPVLQSGLSTILAIVVFIFTPSYINRVFFKILFLVTIFGMLHSLLILPVLLSLCEDFKKYCRSLRSGDTPDSDNSMCCGSIEDDHNINSLSKTCQHIARLRISYNNRDFKPSKYLEDAKSVPRHPEGSRESSLNSNKSHATVTESISNQSNFCNKAFESDDVQIERL